MAESRTWFVTGASGMLGRDVQTALEGRPFLPLDRDALDITDSHAVSAALSSLSAGDVVVNCAAYTAVDDAESDEATAFAVNAVGPQNLARACATSGAHLVHISTDYVFSGDSTEPYAADAPAAPRTAYGRSKAAGEWAVRAELPYHHWILRTAWLYGEHGPSFVRTMAKLEATREFVDVVDDQHGQPTWTRDVAQRIVEIVEAGAPAGIYHACASNQTTWHGLASAVFDLRGASSSRVRPTTSAAFKRPAPRPAFSVLALDSWEKTGLAPIRDWRESLTQAILQGNVTDR
ncbi:dTDP-4-dehydrorhamnose reductase [Kineosporia mesophila]|uniref:dTDP-4-dehydrorhamnose reductase n=1 Tax=Kineosporia mesophila TaxID=566012 RepID=A0ABP6Z283_9ACTN|nr:dTDP-4-dehydrorhamnose reductase [Kineosporia mesophila]MCD5350957.1 dTDP-4-dehydrorhamnose reductase [Kineosporia mesophila]